MSLRGAAAAIRNIEADFLRHCGLDPQSQILKIVRRCRIKSGMTVMIYYYPVRKLIELDRHAIARDDVLKTSSIDL
jgi:hypothetical protein